jgi:hypothetical protein
VSAQLLSPPFDLGDGWRCHYPSGCDTFKMQPDDEYPCIPLALQVAKALAAYAKFDHERADLFVTLARGISELGLSKWVCLRSKQTVL